MPTVTTLGAIDAGSNAIRVLIADASAGGLTRVEAERVPVRLGHGAFTRGELDPATIEAAVTTFARFRDLFDRHGVERYRAVATSALRDSHNGDVLQHRLYHETGIELEVIDGDEEARLIRKAVITAFARKPPPRVVLDLGGGSLEVNVREGDKRWKVASLPIGTVRLMESFGITGAIGADEARMVRRYAATVLRAFLPRGPYDVAPAAACGGNAEALAELLGNKKNGMPFLDVGDLEEALPSILDADIETRMSRFGVRRDRAEVMGVAALVLATVARELDLSRLLVPGVGIREGLLLELVDATADHGAGAAKARADSLLASARTFAARVGHDTAHGEQVRKLARTLFRRLQPVHGLSDRMGMLLEVAALLHDVGEVVDARDHHKHSEYLIRCGRIPGLGTADRELVAQLARTHRKAPPSQDKHPAFAALPRERRQKLRKLAALLRLADGLDTDHRQQIVDMDVRLEDGAVVLEPVIAGAATEPHPSLLRKATLFEELFALRVTCRVLG